MESRYHWLKSHHICVKCGQEDAERNSTMCWHCRIKERERARKYALIHRESLREIRNKQSKDRYKYLKINGICTCCGKRSAKENRTLCKICSSRKNARLRQKYLLYVYATRNIADIRI